MGYESSRKILKGEMVVFIGRGEGQKELLTGRDHKNRLYALMPSIMIAGGSLRRSAQ